MISQCVKLLAFLFALINDVKIIRCTPLATTTEEHMETKMLLTDVCPRNSTTNGIFYQTITIAGLTTTNKQDAPRRNFFPCPR